MNAEEFCKLSNHDNQEDSEMVASKGYNACSVSTVCVIDGPFPDFEIVGITGTVDISN